MPNTTLENERRTLALRAAHGVDHRRSLRPRPAEVKGSMSWLRESAGLCSRRPYSSKKSRNRQVLIDLRPVNIFAILEQTILGALFARSVEKAWVPRERNDDRAAIEQPNDKFVLRG